MKNNYLDVADKILSSLEGKKILIITKDQVENLKSLLHSADLTIPTEKIVVQEKILDGKEIISQKDIVIKYLRMAAQKTFQLKAYIGFLEKRLTVLNKEWAARLKEVEDSKKEVITKINTITDPRINIIDRLFRKLKSGERIIIESSGKITVIETGEIKSIVGDFSKNIILPDELVESNYLTMINTISKERRVAILENNVRDFHSEELIYSLAMHKFNETGEKVFYAEPRRVGKKGTIKEYIIIPQKNGKELVFLNGLPLYYRDGLTKRTMVKSDFLVGVSKENNKTYHPRMKKTKFFSPGYVMITPGMKE